MLRTDRLTRIGPKGTSWRFAKGLDLTVYSKGRQVTLAGRVLGTRTDTVGEIMYVYPLLACLVVYLWPPMPDTRTLYPYDYWWPWYRPDWWRPYPFRRF